MKIRLHTLARLILLGSSFVAFNVSHSHAYEEWKYNFGAGSLGTNPAKNLRLARSVGYEYVYHGVDYEGAYGNWKKDFYFFYNDVHKQIQPKVLRLNGRVLNLNNNLQNALAEIAPYTASAYPYLPRAIDQSEMEDLLNSSNSTMRWIGSCYKYTFEKTKVWANTTSAFPNNIAMLQRWGLTDRFEPCPNVQDQEVITLMVNNIVDYIKEFAEIPSQNYLCAGITMDVPVLWNEFNWASSRPAPGFPYSERYCARMDDGVNYTYQTIREGWYRFLAQLRDRMESSSGLNREVWFLYDPGTLVGNELTSDWYSLLQGAVADRGVYNSINANVAAKVRGDSVSTETRSLYHLLDDELINEYGIDDLSCGTMDHLLDYNLALHIMGNSARKGSSFNYYLGYERTRNAYNQADTFPNELKLLKFASAWDNYREVPVSERFWTKDFNNDGEPFDPIYSSTHTYADKDIVYSINPKNNKLYVSFLNGGAQLRLRHLAAVNIQAISRANGFWEADTNGWNDLTIRRWRWEQNIIPSNVSRYPANYVIDLSTTDNVLIPRTKNYTESAITWEELEKIDFSPFNYIEDYNANWARAFESIAFWRMNNNGADHSPTDADLIRHNGASFTANADAVYGKALRLDGVNDYARTQGNVDLGDAFTIAVWVKIDGSSNNRATVIANRNGPYTTPGFRISVNTAGTNDRSVDFQCGNGTESSRLVTVPGVVPVDTWTHIAVAVDRSGGTATIFINGRVAASGGTFGQVLNDFANNTPIYVGREANAYFKGAIDDLRIYPGKITDNNEVGYLMINP